MRELSATFDRYDIAAAYHVLEIDWNMGGWLQERPSNRRRMESCGVQLHRMGFRPDALVRDKGFAGLNRNARAIYLNATRRLGLRRKGAAV